MLMTAKELAEELRVNRATVYRMMADGRIPMEFAAKVGPHWRFNGEGIVAHLLAQVTEPPRNP